MKPTKISPKKLHSSTPHLPPANKKTLEYHSNEKVLLQHRKQIETTLNELHRLQSQIYDLNIPQNPHSTSPVKKQIKQLSYLYENMTKPKTKNNLNVKSEDIELALRVMNNDWTPDTRLQPEIVQDYFRSATSSNQINLLGKTKTIMNNKTSTNLASGLKQASTGQNANLLGDKSYKLPKTTVKEKFEALTHNPLIMDLISKNEKIDTISTKQLYQFINYTECEQFDPIAQAYEMFLNQDGLFDLNIYNQMNEALGLPKIKNANTFIAAINSTQGNKKSEDDQGKEATGMMTANISLEQFRKVVELQI